MIERDGEGVLVEILRRMDRTGFNPRPCARGDPDLTFARRPVLVSIHAPARGATFHSRHHSESVWFQSTPLREGRPQGQGQQGDSWRFQSTPLREGRLFEGDVVRFPAKFQSTPLREGRPYSATDGRKTTCFNPRPCARGDRI